MSCAQQQKKIPFASRLAKKNKHIEKLFEDVRAMDKKWANDFVNDALALGAKSILVGFPAKDDQRPEAKAGRT